MLAPDESVVVGLSGGADSVSLLFALKEIGITLYATHINHNLRSAAAGDETFVRQLCKDWNIPLLVYQADVETFAKINKLGIEEAGRNLRYKYLHQSLIHFNAKKIALGHNQDDNAETVLLNLFRGTGLKGLCGIPPVNGPIIRPLIEVSRGSIEAFTKKNKLVCIIDETNNQSDYSRNFIRNNITPLIRQHFGENTPSTIARNAHLLRFEEEALEAITNKKKEATNKINIKNLLSHPIAITRRIIRQCIHDLRGESALKDITQQHIDSIIDIAKGQSGREVSLPGFTAYKEYDSLKLCSQKETSIANHKLNLTFTLSLTPPQNQTHCTESFNYDMVYMPLELRTRLPGDKIKLPGGTKKLQDYFTDTKTPKAMRDTTPLLAHGNDILWIMDKHNRINTAYQPVEGQRICWVTIGGDTNV